MSQIFYRASFMVHFFIHMELIRRLNLMSLMLTQHNYRVMKKGYHELTIRRVATSFILRRNVDYQIDLIPCATLVTIPPY